MILRPSLWLIVVAIASRCDGVRGNKGENIVIESAASNATASPKNATAKLPDMCDVCTCKGRSVDCSNRDLENHFVDSQWPKMLIDELTFEGNKFTMLKRFPEVSIEKLILRRNNIAKIEYTAFKRLYNLTFLDLSHNELTSAVLQPEVFEGRFSPESYEPLSKLEVLKLDVNALHVLHQDLFEHVPHLKVLTLSGNPFDVINMQTSLAISSLLYLEELDLSYCNLNAIAMHVFHSTKYLKRLNLSGNRFTVPPIALDDAKSLQYLYMDKNPIEMLHVHNGFPILPALKELSLCYMPNLIKIGAGAFSKLTVLEVLRVEKCPLLEVIHEDALVSRTSEVAVWPPLKKLNLSDNALRYLPAVLVGRWDKLEELDLMNNEWSCDCDNQYLINILLPDVGQKLMGERTNLLKCARPPEHVGKNLTSLANRKLRCLDVYSARPEKDAAVLIGMLIGLLLAIPIGLAIFIFWRRGFLFCGSQGPASFSRAFYKRTSNNEDDI